MNNDLEAVPYWVRAGAIVLLRLLINIIMGF